VQKLKWAEQEFSGTPEFFSGGGVPGGGEGPGMVQRYASSSRLSAGGTHIPSLLQTYSVPQSVLFLQSAHNMSSFL
jgi:hypothetical protein